MNRGGRQAGKTAKQEACPHRPPCTACPRFGEPGIPGAAAAALARLAQFHGLPAVTLRSGALTGYRLRARLAIRGRLGSPKIGLFAGGSHRVVHIPNCRVQHPLINRVGAVVRRALVDARVSCYSDGAHQGLARYLQVVVERATQTAQVVLVANCTDPEPLAPCLELIRARLGGELHSLWFNGNRTQSNAILGAQFHLWSGLPCVVEQFGGAQIHYPPGAFGQNNLDTAQLMIDEVRGQIPEGSRVTELYAGVGAIGLSVLERVTAICLNEISPHSLAGLASGLAQLDPVARAKISVVPGAAGAMASNAGEADVVIADPPRKGLDTQLTLELCETPPRRFIYLSCGLESFLRDTALLTATGRLRLAALTTFNLSPFTEHVETLARFERA